MTSLTSKNTAQVAKSSENHPFHIVDPSPWPAVMSVCLFDFLSGAVLYMHNYKGGYISMLIGLVFVVFAMVRWFSDIVVEATFEGQHTLAVQKGLRYGMLLFIVSEVMFFLSFFWAFFHSSISPGIGIGCVWPPIGINLLDTWGIPFLNTLLLLSSGVTLTWTHRALLSGNWSDYWQGIAVTILLGVVFTINQYKEYVSAEFSINDSIYGSVFYMATGFHGFHVLVGTIFLAVCLGRFIAYHFTVEHHFGFEAAAWYWHFVDVVWLFLFVSIYWWGSC